MLNELIEDIQMDFRDEEGQSLIEDEVAERMAERALPVAASDMGRNFSLNDGEVLPVMSADEREVWFLRTKILILRHLRAQSANMISFSSGDKSVSRGREAANWAELEKSLLAEYNARVRRINPASDEELLLPQSDPLLYTQLGRQYERSCEHEG